jgi:hypothetical protein
LLLNLGGPVLGFCLLLAAAQAATPTPYGEHFARWNEAALDPRPAPLAGGQQARRPLERSDYEAQVALLERSQGPYADALAEPLAGLGRYYRDNGELEQAQGLYRRALHIVRVNDGLYSQRQAPILRELLDGYRSTGDMEGLDDRYEYYFRLYGNGQPPYSELRLRAALEFLRWQREALLRGLGEPKQRMLDLYRLNQELLERTARDPGVELAWRRELTLSQLRNLYLLQHLFTPTIETKGIIPASNYFGAVTQAQDLQDRSLDNIFRNSLTAGSGLLLELIDASSRAPVADRARLLLELADWYHWNDQRYRATDYYGQVAALLRESGEDELLDEWLAQPVELPDNGAFMKPLAGPAVSSPVVVTVSYDVSASGRVRNLDASADGEEGRSQASKVRRYLSKTRFRPRYLSGQGEEVDGVRREYVLLQP